MSVIGPLPELITALRCSAIVLFLKLALRVAFHWQEMDRPDAGMAVAESGKWWRAAWLWQCAAVIVFFSPEHIARLNNMPEPGPGLRIWLALGGVICINASAVCALQGYWTFKQGIQRLWIWFAAIPAIFALLVAPR